MPRRNRRRKMRRSFRRITKWLRRQKRSIVQRASGSSRPNRTVIPPDVKVKVWERDGHWCQRCRQPYDDSYRLPTIHHLNGNPSDHRFHEDRTSPENNVIGWCRPCQQEHHHQIPRAERKRRREDPPHESDPHTTPPSG